MQTINLIQNKQLNVKSYSLTTRQGLKIYCVIPDKNTKPFNYNKIILTVNYGGDDREYIDRISGKNILIPEGTAHLVEHLVCNKNKKNFEMFKANLEMDTLFNAQTCENHTKYYINFLGDFKKPLDYIMNMIFKGDITEESLEKEKGIVFTEIATANKYNNFESIVTDDVYKFSFIAGKKEDMADLDINFINNIYYNYYVPSNMAIIIYGDVLPCKVFEEIENKLDDMKIQKSPKPIKVKQYKKVKEDKIVLKDNYSIIYLFFKYDNYSKEENINMSIAFKIFSLLNIFFNPKIKEYMQKEKINLDYINLFFNYSIEDNYGSIRLYLLENHKSNESIIELLENFNNKNVTKEQFNLAKKYLYNNNIIKYRKICDEVNDSFINSTELFSEVDALEKMTLEKYSKYIEKIINYKESYIRCSN